MKIWVKRFKKGENSTLSAIYLDEKFCCFGLEDTVRDEKIWGSTAIPTGVYQLGIRKLGGMHAHYSRLFPNFHQGMIEILDIPNFKYVYIHIGNNFADTSGCLLVGDSFVYEEEDYVLKKSKVAYTKLYKQLIDSVKSGEAVIVIEEDEHDEAAE